MSHWRRKRGRSPTAAVNGQRSTVDDQPARGNLWHWESWQLRCKSKDNKQSLSHLLQCPLALTTGRDQNARKRRRMRRKRKGQTMHDGWHTKGAASARAPEISLSLPLPEMDTSWGRLRGQLARFLGILQRGIDLEWYSSQLTQLRQGLIVRDFTQLSLFASSHSPALSLSLSLSPPLCSSAVLDLHMDDRSCPRRTLPDCIQLSCGNNCAFVSSDLVSPFLFAIVYWFFSSCYVFLFAQYKHRVKDPRNTRQMAQIT